MHYVLIPFAWLLRMLYHLFNNYGVALILFSLITKLILMPFTAKSKKSMMKTSRLGPKLKELEAKCGDDKMKYQQEMQALYKKEGVSPMSGCLWSLLPLVLLMALYYVIRQPMTYLMQLSADQITQIQDYMTSSGLVELATSGRGSYYTEIVLAQAVYDNIHRAEAAMKSYEAKLGLAARYESERAVLSELDQSIAELATEANSAEVDGIRARLAPLLGREREGLT